VHRSQHTTTNTSTRETLAAQLVYEQSHTMANKVSPVSSHNENVDDEYHLQLTTTVKTHSDTILDLVASNDKLCDSSGSLDLDCHPAEPQQEISGQRQSRADKKKQAIAQRLTNDMALKDMAAETAAKQHLFPKQKQQHGKEGKESYWIGLPEHPRPQPKLLKPYTYLSSQAKSIKHCDEKPKGGESISSVDSDSGELVIYK
jgi:hypothetical protein